MLMPNPSKRLKSELDNLFEAHRQSIAEVDKIQHPTAVKVTFKLPSVESRIENIRLSSIDPSVPALNYQVSSDFQAGRFAKKLETFEFNQEDKNHVISLSPKRSNTTTVRLEARLKDIELNPHALPSGVVERKASTLSHSIERFSENLTPIQPEPLKTAIFETSKLNIKLGQMQDPMPSAELARSIGQLTISKSGSSTPLLRATLSQQDRQKIVRGEIRESDVAKVFEQVTISYGLRDVSEDARKAIAQAMDVPLARLIVVEERQTQSR